MTNVVIRFFKRLKNIVIISTCCTKDDKVIVYTESSPVLDRKFNEKRQTQSI